MNKLYENIKKRREYLGMTQDELAKKLGYRSRSSINKIELGISDIPQSKISAFALALNTTPAELMGWDKLSPDTIPYVRGRRLPILGSIPAGSPVLAVENIEGYDYADVPEGEDYFFLRVKGDSMINAGIKEGDLVLVQQQACAENGQIVVCLINGDEATLKRFHQKGDVIILQPENTAYLPIIISSKDFDHGYARIIGVAKEIKRKL